MANTQQQFNQLPQYTNSILTNGGKMVQAWYRFHNNVLKGTPPADISPVAVGPSPFLYTTTQGGFIVVQGGTVTMISTQRGTGAPVNSGVTQGHINISAGDSAIIVYTTKPNITFFPQ